MTVDFESAKDGELSVRGHVSSEKVFKFYSASTLKKIKVRNSLINFATQLT
jgi:hypothetical protein